MDFMFVLILALVAGSFAVASVVEILSAWRDRVRDRAVYDARLRLIEDRSATIARRVAENKARMERLREMWRPTRFTDGDGL